MSQNQIHSVATGVQRNLMLVMERSDLRNELWQNLLAANDWTANYNRRNKIAPHERLIHELQHEAQGAQFSQMSQLATDSLSPYLGRHTGQAGGQKRTLDCFRQLFGRTSAPVVKK